MTSHPSRFSQRHAVRGLGVFAAALLALLGGCKRPPAPEAAPPEDILSVNVATVERTVFQRTQDVAGTVRPVDRAVVSARIMGVVEHADFALGQRVAAGDVLVTLGAAEIAARVEQVRAALAQVVADHERETALHARGASPADTVRILADRRRAAEGALEEALTLQGYTRVTAPFAGTITRKLVNPGDLAVAGTPLLEIEGETALRAEVEVPASLPAVSIGASLRGRVAAIEFAGVLSEISSASDPRTRTRLAKILLPENSGVRSGDFVRIAWPVGEGAALTVPAAAVAPLGQMERVFVVQDDRVSLRIVKTAGILPSGSSEAGVVDPATVRIAAGLDAGEVVVVNAPSALRDGQRVEVVR